MTVETLKPFILPASDNFHIHNSNPKNSGRQLWTLIGLSVALLILSAGVIYITAWQVMKIDTLEKEIQNLRNEFTDMKRKYGFDDLDDLDEIENEYRKNNKENEIDEDEDYLDSYEQSGNYLTNHFNDFESDDEDESYDEDNYSSEDRSQKVRIIRSIDVSVYTNSKVEQDKEEKKNLETKKRLKHKRKQYENYNRKLNSYSFNYQKRRPQVKTMTVNRPGKKNSNHNSLAAAHYYMNSTVPGNHPHNITHMKVPHDGDIYIGAAHPWTQRYDGQNHFDIEHGFLKVKETGVYYVYSQVLYENNFDKNGYRIYHNDYPFLQCALTIPNNMPKSNTCHTSGAIFLQKDDTLHIRDLFKGRTVALKSAKSFFGIVKLASGLN